MLILTRKYGEKIIIGDDITVQIIGVKGGCVKIAIDAPKDISVHREEIYKKIHKEIENNKESQNE